MISKELLSEVLGEEVIVVKIVYGDEKHNYIYYDFIEKNSRVLKEVSINIYELAHKCKEWAYQKGYSFYTGLLNGRWEVVSKISELFSDEAIEFKHEFKDETEPEAIFKACQWILDNKDKS